MSNHLLIPVAILFLYIARACLKHSSKNTRNLPLPPGPPPIPLLGNIYNLPTSHEWLTYARWSKQYGDIVHINVLGDHIILLNSLSVVTDLFDKRSAIYSDRPRMPMLKELMGWDWSFAFLGYGPWWRRHRKAFHHYFHPAASESYCPSQTIEVRRMLLRLLSDPTDFCQHIRLTASATIMRVAYGIEVSEKGDRYINAAEEAMNSLAQAGVPGAFLVDTIPILKYIPSWFPGAGFQKKALAWRKLVEEFINTPFAAVKTALASGTARPSLAANLLENIRNESADRSPADIAEDEVIAKNIAAISYAGGADTTVSAIQTFFLAMVLYPDVQKRAQAEIDRVVGRDRLPEFADRPALPYIEAIVKETFRWQPVTPLAVAHRVTEDDEYAGYYIPKGSILMGNTWSILHDDKMYPDPSAYRPERFLTPDLARLDPHIRDPDTAAFGFGRRICPGRHMATNGAFITIASVLAAFTLEHAVDDAGNRIEVKPEMTSGLLSYPEPFKCVIKPRSDAAVALIHQGVEQSTW